MRLILVSRMNRRFAAAVTLVFALHAATPADFRREVGVYVWGKLAAGLPAAVADVQRLGATGCVRVAIGTRTTGPASASFYSTPETRFSSDDAAI